MDEGDVEGCKAELMSRIDDLRVRQLDEALEAFQALRKAPAARPGMAPDHPGRPRRLPAPGGRAAGRVERGGAERRSQRGQGYDPVHGVGGPRCLRARAAAPVRAQGSHQHGPSDRGHPPCGEESGCQLPPLQRFDRGLMSAPTMRTPSPIPEAARTRTGDPAPVRGARPASPGRPRAAPRGPRTTHRTG